MIKFFTTAHFQEIEELMQQIYAGHASAADVYSLPDLSSAIKQIQHEYDDIAAKNLQVKIFVTNSVSNVCHRGNIVHMICEQLENVLLLLLLLFQFCLELWV